MNSVANEVSGEKVLFGIVTDEPAEAFPAEQDCKPLVRLEVSWHAAPLQNVAILDSTGIVADKDFSSPTPTGPVATAAQSRPPKYKYL